jgi:hypothetical protein
MNNLNPRNLLNKQLLLKIKKKNKNQKKIKDSHGTYYD